MMKRQRLTCCYFAVAIGCLQVAGAIYTGCSPGTHRVISYDNTLVPPSGVRASSEDTLFNPDDNLFHRNNIPLRLWCSESFEEATREEGVEPEGGTTTSYSDFDFQNFSSSFYIAVNFSEPLLLTHIITSGFSNGYVNNFTLQYSLEGAESLETFGYSDTVQEFVSEQIDTVFPLREPLAALRLRFDINDGLMTPTGRLCWHLTLLGCTVDEALKEVAPPNITFNSPTPDVTTPPPPACPTEASTPPQPSSVPTTSSEGATATMTTVDNSQLLLFVLPTSAAVVLALVILIILVGVCICLRCSPGKWRRRGSSRLSTDAIAGADTLGMVDNELYRSRSSIFPMTVHHTGAMAIDKNAAAAAATTGQSGQSLYENCDSDPAAHSYNNMFPSFKESCFYETISPRNPEIEQSTKSINSMVDNPNYSVPFPLSYHPLDTTQEEVSTPPPLPRITPRFLKSRIGASTIDMVDNECYSVPSAAGDSEGFGKDLEITKSKQDYK